MRLFRGRRNLHHDGAVPKIERHDVDEVLGLATGLRIVLSGLSEGSRLDGRIVLAGPAAEAEISTFFLGKEDEVEVSAGAMGMKIHGEEGIKILLLPGTQGRVEEIELPLDGEELPPTLPASSPTWPRSYESLLSAQALRRPEDSALRLWYRGEGKAHQGEDRDQETLDRLRALGYID